MIAMIGNALLLALRELRRNVLRSILTMLGIIIGVASVIILVTLGSGATRKWWRWCLATCRREIPPGSIPSKRYDMSRGRRSLLEPDRRSPDRLDEISPGNEPIGRSAILSTPKTKCPA
jgi:hypothetical protein